MPIISYPEFDAWRGEGKRQLRGVFVGGCVTRGDGSSFRRKAHAHFDGPYANWICVRSAKRLYQSSGKPTLLMWHELTHVVSGQGHTAKFEATMRSLCGRSDIAKYRRERNARRRSNAALLVRYRWQPFAALETAPDCTKECGRPSRGWLVRIRGNSLSSDATCGLCAIPFKPEGLFAND